MMRDILCKVEDLKETIDFNECEVKNKKEKIDALYIDIKNGVQRFPKKNEDIIHSTKGRIFQLLYETICAKYSLGMELESLEESYGELVLVIEDIGWEKIGYVHFIQVFALGILLEVSDVQLEKFVRIADKGELDDCLFDFLVRSCGLSRKMSSENYQKENPYKGTANIIGLSFEDKEKAAKELVNYMERKWFQGHFDYDWKNAHKQSGYVGFWSFETAALAKILGIADNALQKNNHYPYDLAHFKDNIVFSIENIMVAEDKEMCKVEEIEIEQNRDLESIIPNQFRDFVNQIIVDYKNLSDLDFWKKYKLQDIWYTVDEYLNENVSKKLLGTIIVNVLVEKDYILQLDYKGDIEEYIANMKNYWGKSPVKIIRFELDNDQYYYAIVPKEAHLDKLYEVDVLEEKISIK